VLLIGSCVVID